MTCDKPQVPLFLCPLWSSVLFAASFHSSSQNTSVQYYSAVNYLPYSPACLYCAVIHQLSSSLFILHCNFCTIYKFGNCGLHCQIYPVIQMTKEQRPQCQSLGNTIHLQVQNKPFTTNPSSNPTSNLCYQSPFYTVYFNFADVAHYYQSSILFKTFARILRVAMNSWLTGHRGSVQASQLFTIYINDLQESTEDVVATDRVENRL